MSVYTDIILKMGKYDWEKHINDIECFLKESSRKECKLNRIDNFFYGEPILIGKIEGFILYNFLEYLKELNWQNYSNVQLLIKDENDENYKTWFIDEFYYEVMRVY
jgi:hypothetical protein